MLVYVAASFAYEDKEKTSQRKYQIEKIIEQIKARREVFPRDQFYLPHQLKIPNAWDISLEEWSRKVYEHDLSFLETCDLVIFISFGKENNSGSVWEVGYAAALTTKVVVIKMTDEPESLMVTESAHAIIKADEIERYDWYEIPPYKTKLDKIS